MVIGTMSTPPAHAGSLWGPSTPAEPTIVTHPNRDKPAVQGTRVIVVLLFLISAALVLVVTVCGWNVLESAWVIQVAYIVVYLTLAFFAARWNRGVLPVGAALAVLLTVFALVSGPFWFDRNHPGFAATNYLNAGLLGVITLLLVPVQILLIAFAMRGFNQGWNVEVERPASMVGGARPYADAPPPYPA